MPYSVKQLLEDNPPPVTVTQADSVADALRMMAEHDYSQLPVVDADNKPIGLVTPEGILRGLRNFELAIDQLNIREAMSKPSKFSQDDNLFDLLQQLQAHGAVLIIDATAKLVGIVTNYDTTDYFRERAENIMLVEDIETLIKEFILAAHEDADGNVDDDALAKAADKAAYYPDSKKPRKQKQFDDLSLSEYISLLLSQKLWTNYESSFNMPSKNVRNLLEKVRKTRNELAHFRDDISNDQSEQLRYCSMWLGRCWEAYQQTKTDKPKGEGTVTLTFTMPVGKELESWSRERFSTSETATPTDSRYAPLANFLDSIPPADDQVNLSFTDVEKIIGGDLPASARKHQAWWANDTSNSSKHSVLWLEAGWRRSRLSLTNETVSFTRIKEREQAYISFYSTMRARLSDTSDVQLYQSPTGAAWDTWQSILSKPTVAWFAWSFSRGKRFRIELYLKPTTGNEDQIKPLFDAIYAHKAQIEVQTGPLSWERLDDRKASRIALYHPGSITDEAETLDALQEWAVANSILFYKAIEPIGQAAINQLLCPV